MTDDLALRASDADRDRAAAVLGGALFAKRAIYGRGDPAAADGPVIRIVGDARFAKVAVHRGRFDPSAPWQHGIQQVTAGR
jgi:hypothetical protein